MSKFILLFYLIFFALKGNSQTADFTYTSSNGLFCGQASVQFNQISSGSPSGFFWTFGNGTASNLANPQITFTKPGSYTVKMVVIYQQNTVSVVKTITINAVPNLNIGYDRNYICQPGIINFKANTNGNIQSYNWDFGDGSAKVSDSTGSEVHNFLALGSYTVNLFVKDISGCSATAQTVIKVSPVSTTGTATPSSGCIPAAVKLSVNPIIPLNSAVSSYIWDFGDGSSTVSTAVNTINHTFNKVGSYLPTVTINTTEGCTNIYNFNTIAFGIPPTNENAYAIKSTICGSETASFVATGTNANAYYWNFGDGTSIISLDTGVTHKYKTLGTKNVAAVPNFNGCVGNAIVIPINIIGVIASYDYSDNCVDKRTFLLNNTSQGNISSTIWDFGDGSPMANTLNATHTYPLAGAFPTTLKITDNITGCSDVNLQTIYTAAPQLINSDTSICRNSMTTFSLANNYNNPGALYTWYVAGKKIGPIPDSTLITKTTIFGKFNNYVVINNGGQYCADTIQLDHPIQVRGPKLNFTAPAAICLGNTVTVIDSSMPYRPQDPVTLYYWNFGASNLNDTTYQPQPYLYGVAGTYNVQLTATDILGCTDSLVKPVNVSSIPYLFVIPKTDTLCSGMTDTLVVLHSDSITWSPGTYLSCATCDTVITSATTNTTYHITASNQAGCSTTDSIVVKVFPPFTATSFQTNAYVCLNDTIRLHVDPRGKKIVWTPAAGLSNPNGYDPVASPTANTVYKATLTDSVGCFSSTININVTIKSLPTVDAGPNQFYPYNASFTLNPKYSNNVTSYNWTPGNLLNCNTCPDPSGVATKSNTYYIAVTSDSGCVAKDSVRISVECKASYLLMPSAFTPNGDNLNDFFYPLTRGVQSIIRFSIYDRLGNLVFEAKNFPPNEKTFGWNGTVHGAYQPTAVFVYYMEALCESGEKLYKKGSVVLVR